MIFQKSFGYEQNLFNFFKLQFHKERVVKIEIRRRKTYNLFNHANMMYGTQELSFVKRNQSFHPYHRILQKKQDQASILNTKKVTGSRKQPTFKFEERKLLVPSVFLELRCRNHQVLHQLKQTNIQYQGFFWLQTSFYQDLWHYQPAKI